MSSTLSSHSNSPSPISLPPPPPAVDNDASTSEAARKHLEPTSRFPLSLSTPNLRQGAKSKRSKPKFRLPFRASTISTTSGNHEEDQGPTSPQPVPDIALNDQPLHENNEDENDRYEWAVLYENQRGITLFSVPYYSSNSLLPTDPPPFTLPTADPSTSDKEAKVTRSTQPTISSLNDYPLPDGTWHWVSRSWMIDMRSDSGEVQHDGFEYNWVFRKHDWRAHTGTLSSGGYVRRRRWVRMMVRPGKKTREGENMADSIASPTESPSAPSLRASWVEGHLNAGRGRRQSMPASSIPARSLAGSVVSGSGMSDQSIVEMWQGNLEEDWKMCKYLLREAARDGAKLELWKRWLGLEATDAKEPMSSSASVIVPSINYVKDILRVHATEIVEAFTFPESRARFIAFLEEAGVYSDLQRGLDPSWSRTSDAGLAFWSLNSEIDLGQEKGKEADRSTDPKPDNN